MLEILNAAGWFTFVVVFLVMVYAATSGDDDNDKDPK